MAIACRLGSKWLLALAVHASLTNFCTLGKTPDKRHAKLKALEPVSVGHVRTLGRSGSFPADGWPSQMRTLALDPPVFLIPQFLSAEEADSIVSLAQTQPEDYWMRSEAGDGHAQRILAELSKGGKAARRRLMEFDYNKDKALDLEEIAQFAKEAFQVVDYDEDVHRRLLQFSTKAGASGFPGASSGKLLIAEALKRNVELSAFFRSLVEEEPYRKDRFSDQVWLEYDTPLLRDTLRRVGYVTGTPDEIIRRSESMQVVHYKTRGHYSAHHDSSPDSLEVGDIRFATFGFFLNNVTRGGETVFPGADLPDAGKFTPHDWSELEQQVQATQACTRSGGLVAQPRKGDALFWYNVRPSQLNHLSNFKSRGFGERTVQWNSMHCAAEVLEGEKWFANVWLRANTHRAARSEL